MAKLTLTNIATGLGSTNDINANFDAIEAAFELCFFRDGTSPNTATSDLDMNSQRILNLPEPINGTEPLRLADVNLLTIVEAGSITVPGSTTVNNVPAWGDTTATTLTGSTLDITSTGIQTTISGSQAVLDLQSDITTGTVAAVHGTGDNDAAEAVEYGRVNFVAVDDTDGAEDGRIDFTAMVAGTSSDVMSVSGDGLTIGPASNVTLFDIISDRTSGNVASIRIYGDNAAAESTNTTKLTSVWTQTTDGDEYSKLDFKCMRGGTLTTGLTYQENTTDITELELNSTNNGNITIASQRSTASQAIGYLQFKGKDSGANTTSYSQIVSVITDPTDGAEDGKLKIRTVQGAAEGDRMSVGNGAWMEGATGTDQGAGTLNAVGVYDDGVLLSCYPFDMALDGAVDFGKWDNKVPDLVFDGGEVSSFDEDGKETKTKQPDVVVSRKHEGARKFAARVGTKHDPLTTDGYAKHWKEKRHLTALPNETKFDPVDGKLSTGEWLQRLVETVETQAILIEELNQRLKTVEKAQE